MNPDSVGAMWAFVRVVEAGSMTAAARELGVTPSGVSKQLSRLEGRLGVRLLQRTTRQVRPTEAGMALYDRCRHLFDALDDAEESARSLATRLAGTIRLTASSALGRAHVVPALAEFALAHPGVDFEVTLTGRRVDLIGEGIDLAIREGRLADSGLVATRLTEFGIALCASPGYLAGKPAPRVPEDLAGHDFLSIESATLESELIAASFRVERVEMRSRFRVNDLFSLRELALAGCGIAALPIYLIDDALADRSLVRVLDHVALPRVPVTALCPERRYQPHRVRVLLEFLKQRFRRTL